jgi:sensor histidine kinase regulating citrate/malate metabolism
MSITTDRIVESVAPFDDNAKFHLFEALSSTLDSLVNGVIIVANQARILHANQAAQHMLDAKSPILSLAGRLCALQAERTKELQRAIAAAQARNPIEGGGIGVPLRDKHGAAAGWHGATCQPISIP